MSIVWACLILVVLVGTLFLGVGFGLFKLAELALNVVVAVVLGAERKVTRMVRRRRRN